MTTTPTPPSWDISKEREFIENLLCQRFNFFLAFFSIVSAGAIGTIHYEAGKVNVIASAVILLVGGFICWLIRSVLSRSQEKLDIILDHGCPVMSS
jgi:hypothetical protein